MFLYLDTSSLVKLIVAQAGELAEKHAVRGFDSIHLASAISLRDQVASSVAFSAWDARLLSAAKAEGLGVNNNAGMLG